MTVVRVHREQKEVLLSIETTQWRLAYSLTRADSDLRGTIDGDGDGDE